MASSSEEATISALESPLIVPRVPSSAPVGVHLEHLAGADFLQALVVELQRRLGVEWVFVGDLVEPSWDRVTTLAIAGPHGPCANRNYDLPGTPCERVAAGETCLQPSELRTRFPGDALALELELESYVGAPLFDDHGRIVGLIGASDTRAMPAPQMVLDTLMEFAPRVAADLAQRRDAAMLRLLLASSDAAGASRSIAQLAAALRASLQVRTALISELLPGEPRRMRLRGISMNGATPPDLEGLVLDIGGSPCARVFEQGWLFHARDLAHCYPDLLPVLERLGREAYLGRAFHDRDGHIIGHVAVVHDRPMHEELAGHPLLGFFALRAAAELERERAEALRLAAERAELVRQRMEGLGRLAGGIAHDFNNLLVGILGNAALAQVGAAPAQREPLAEIELAARRASDLANQLLAYSGKGPFLVADVDLNALCEETVRLLRSSLPAHAGLHLELASEPILVRGDETQLRQVLMNLLLNACDALGERAGSVTLRTGRACLGAEELRACVLGGDVEAGEYVVLEVSDTGCGMDAATRAHIFEPFFTTKFTGRGLGLSAVQGILGSHRGALALESQPGAGSRFRVYLPPAAHAPVAPPQAVPTCGSEGRGVLLVDDEELVRRSTARMLRHLGYHVLEAQDGPRALELLRAQPGAIEVVLLDMTMPGMNGAATCTALHELRPGLPVVLTSGYDEHETLSSFPDRALAGFLRKPFHLQELDTRLAAALAQESAV